MYQYGERNGRRCFASKCFFVGSYPSISNDPLGCQRARDPEYTCTSWWYVDIDLLTQTPQASSSLRSTKRKRRMDSYWSKISTRPRPGHIHPISLGILFLFLRWCRWWASTITLRKTHAETIISIPRRSSRPFGWRTYWDGIIKTKSRSGSWFYYHPAFLWWRSVYFLG